MRTWWAEAEASRAETRTGKALNRLNILSVPVPKTRHLWNNLKVTKREVRITVGIEAEGRVEPVTMVFRHHASDELVYCEPTADSLKRKTALDAALRLEVALLYPMSGISADEAVILPQRIEFLPGRGSTAEVLRNLALQVHQKAPQDWREVASLMMRLFHVQIGDPVVNKKGGVDLVYRQDGTSGEMDLGLSGRGFQQMLLIFSHLFLHKGSVLLIDEPDAHLEILRQQQVYALLRDIARRNDCQVVMVTHSEVLLREALDRNLTLILQGRAENLAKKEDIRAALKHFGAEHYVRARETGHVIYLEGRTDWDMLRAFSKKLGHPVAERFEDGSKLNIYFLQDNNPSDSRSVEDELERVEGGYGMGAGQHFAALRSMLPSLRGLVIRDGDARSRTDTRSGPLQRMAWRRYEPENYFITPPLLLQAAQQRLPASDLFETVPRQTLDRLVLERVFEGSTEDFRNFSNADPSTRKTLWRAQTQHLKLSAFAEEYFRQVAAETGASMAFRKGSLHELVSLSDPADLNGEVKEKLDALHELLEQPLAGSSGSVTPAGPARAPAPPSPGGG